MLDPDWFARYQAHVLCSVLLARRLLDARVHIFYITFIRLIIFKTIFLTQNAVIYNVTID